MANISRTFLLIVFLLSNISTTSLAHAEGQTLKNAIWKHRVVVIDRGHSGAAALADELISRRDELLERDILLYIRSGETGTVVPSNVQNLSLSEFAILEKYKTPFLLIGKDGGVKMKYASGVNAGEIFRRIDAMPMRMREMREKK